MNAELTPWEIRDIRKHQSTLDPVWSADRENAMIKAGAEAIMAKVLKHKTPIQPLTFDPKFPPDFPEQRQDRPELLDIQRLWCQHCKSMQKTNDTIVECWYNPLGEDMKPAFCAANEDACKSIVAIFPDEEEIRKQIKQELCANCETPLAVDSQKQQIVDAVKQERKRISTEGYPQHYYPAHPKVWAEALIVRDGYKSGLAAFLQELSERWQALQRE